MNTATAPLVSTLHQQDQILSHLHSIDHDSGKRRGLTHYEALALYRIPRLAARVHELREMGHNIVSHSKTDNTGKRYVRYFLESRHNRK